ncbi:alpha/beta-hydrolase [Exidia glandulosa HHB12029]|uniref:Alpha/beta-hydrolase n=1 Tax=Exidia glandulosa HHB12029 TaxID=1314781 RepID=A0A166AFT6_EXIGL|nr:alpha/beta-hydrolase [Exidia glandulosa HHB12029]
MEKSQLPQPSAAGTRKRLPFVQRVLFSLVFSVLFFLPNSRVVWEQAQVLMRGAPSGSAIKWTTCGDVFECGRLEVPLDYFNASKGTASISLARIPAANTSSRLGSIFFNPGGPGGSGVNFVYRTGKSLAALLDGRYDIVSWDPRGVNGTTPRGACFPSQTEQTLFTHHTGLEVGNLSDPIDRNVFEREMRAVDARDATVARVCELNPEASVAVQHMDTATVVRDLVRIADTIQGPGTPINYWGFSYGTLLGNYFVNMFPTRVGRVIVDGNLDPVTWATARFAEWTPGSLRDSQKAHNQFMVDCAKVGPERCALASNSSTAESITKTVDGILKQLYDRPLPVPGAKHADVLTSSHMRQLLFAGTYKPSLWPGIAKILADVARGDGAAALELIDSTVELDESKQAETSLSSSATICSDAPPIPEGIDNLGELTDAVVRMYEDGLTLFASRILVGCHNWRLRAPKRFTGPFNHTLSNTILVIGNTADPVTPLANAMRVNKLLQDSSRLIIQDSSGHCSLAAASLCTANAIRGYFLNGTLPENGLFCPVSEETFPTNGDSASVSTWLTAEERTEENVRVLDVVRDIGRTWRKSGYPYGV